MKKIVCNRSMKKNKGKSGFTLIELLAVIVILGLLIGIAYPFITKYVVGTRNDTYSLHEADMKTAASNMMSQCVQNDTMGCVPENGESRTIYLRELIDSKYSEVVRDPADTDKYCDADKSYVVVSNSSNNVVELDYQVCLVCSDYQSDVCGSITPGSKCDPEDDPTPPSCGEVIGSSTIWTNNDRVISVKCSDEGGCGCSQKTYYKTFTESKKTDTITISDKAGNSKDCEVNVYVDKEKPTCTLEVVGSLGENGWYGGKAPIVKFVTKEDNLSQVVTYGMGTSKKNYDFNKLDEYEVKAGISMIYGYVKDNAGNVGTCSVEVKYDNAKPTGNITFGYQVYPKDDIASTSGSVITLNSVTSEYGNIIGVKVYLTENTSGMDTVIKNGGTELSKRTISAGVVEMLYAFTSGTYNNLTIDMGSSSNLSKVKKVELITDHTSGFYTNQDVKVYINSQDSLSGKAYYSFDGGSSWQSSNEKTYSSNQSFKVGMKDAAGNISDYKSIDINNIDKEKPSIKIVTSGAVGDNNWFINNLTLSLEKSDSGVSGIREFGLTTSSSVTYNNVSTTTQDSDTTGTVWYGYISDKAGNTNKVQITVKRDTVVPTCTVSPSGTKGTNDWYTSNVTFSLTTNDATSKVASYGIGTSTTANYNSSTSATLSSDSKSITYYGYVKDNAGHTGSCSSTVKRDTTKPDVPEIDNPYDSVWSDVNFSLTVSSSDATSGLADWYYTYDPSSWVMYANSNGVSPFTTTEFSAERNQNVYIKVCDKAGNCSQNTTMIKIDKCVSPTSTYGSYGACSASCGGGTQTRTVYKTGISGKSCGTSTESVSCNNSPCQNTTFTYCPNPDSLFGSAATRTPGLGANDRPENYGSWLTGLSSYKCYASGNESNGEYCNRTCGYDRICITDLCGSWKGKTAREMRAANALPSGCSYEGVYWCQCDYGYCS